MSTTSLIDILAGRQKSGELSGSIGLKSQDNSVVLLQTEYGKQFWKTNSAYVMQDDVFLGNLTVFETLSYAYDLNVVDPQYDRKEKDARITAILKALKLEKVKNSRVGDALKRGISGGETRRLSIAVELVTKPGLLFLDEPTSGLDSVNALNVIKAVKLLCQTYNTTIVCTIHQPSSTIFQMFDNLLILDAGKIVYFGGALASIECFNNKGYDCPIYMNPAEFILDVVLSADNSSEVIDVRSNIVYLVPN
ncbi:hypothetical protein MP638_005594 [Amoeboaphelidium occidentale]|nr:hypothetical protein MP638_005594 [Amoeboaphelidium occidentale]